MLVWRVIAAALAVLLIGVVIVDLTAEPGASKRVLLYEKGTYLGKPDTGITDDMRAQIRMRASQAGAQ